MDRHRVHHAMEYDMKSVSDGLMPSMSGPLPMGSARRRLTRKSLNLGWLCAGADVTLQLTPFTRTIHSLVYIHSAIGKAIDSQPLPPRDTSIRTYIFVRAFLM